MIYVVRNLLTYKGDFFVPDQQTLETPRQDESLISSVVIGTEADAQTDLRNKQTELLAQNSIRFNICIEEVDGDNTVWRNAEDTDPEDATYKVFNSFTGTYTDYPSFSQAKAANEALKQEFLVYSGIGSVGVVDTLPLLPEVDTRQPISTGVQKL